MIERSDIATLIPHAGTMLLLDRVLAWDETSIRCASSRHRLADNPLRTRGRLGALCGIEFAAQAMAVHGRLAGAINERPPAGYVASLRDVVCHCEWLDGHAGDLAIEATRLMGEGEVVMYAFSLKSGALTLVSGRATVLLKPAGAS